MKLKRKKRNVNHLCPNCMSMMSLESGGYTCTGDRFEYWKQEFKKYEVLSGEQQQNYLNTISDIEMFLDLYKDRKNITCGFSTKLVSIVPDNSIRIPDPMVVGKIEVDLGRALSILELEEGFTFYRKGRNFSIKPLNNYNTFKVPFITFPDDC